MDAAFMSPQLNAAEPKSIMSAPTSPSAPACTETERPSPPPLRHRTTTGPGLYRELRQHGSRWDGWGARVARLLRGLVGLVREAGAAGGTARFPGGSEGHLVPVAIAHE